MVRWACRAERFDCLFCGVFRIVTGPAPKAVLPGVADEAALGAAEPCSVVPDRRNVRAGDDGELGGGSGISHANAAAETDGGSAGVAETLGDGRSEGAVLEGAVLEGPAPKGAVREEAAGQASSPDGFAADPAGSAAAVADRADADGGGSKLNAGESSTEDCSAALLGGVFRSASAAVGRLPRDVPMESAGSAGTPSATVASAAGRAGSFTVAADPPLVVRPARVPSDAASSGGAAMAGAGLAAVGFCCDGLGGTTMPPGCASSSPIRSSSVALDVTTVGEPPPEPSGLSVRLSKPSSL